MFDRLLPQHVDNSFRGHKLALWLFAVVVFMKTSIGLGTIFNGRNAAVSADGIPLDTFGPPGEQAFLSVFAVWGLAQATIGFLCLIVLVRYRALVPLMFALVLLEHLLRRLIFFVMPISRTGDAPGLLINVALIAVLVVGLALSLRRRPD
jgi:MYXO-CTERM domain-containing protein